MNKKPDPIPVTQEALEKAKVDLERLLKEEQEVLVRLQQAREMGDLSENGAYKYAKFELGNVRRELGQVKRVVRYGKVIVANSDGTIGLGNRVKLEGNGKTIEFVLVGDTESNPLNKKLSIKSPYGLAVEGKKQGDVVTVQAPAGEVEFRVVEVE